MSRLVMPFAALLLVACTSTAPVAEPPTTAPPSPTPIVTATPAPTDPPTPSPSPSPRPTQTARATPSPSPTAAATMSEEELAQAFLLMADTLNAGICAENQVIESASDRELFDVATASFARSASDTETFAQAVLDLFSENTGNPMLLSTASWLHEASLDVEQIYQQVAEAKDIDEVFDLFDTRTRRDAENNMKSAGSTMREYLGLPPRPDDPCIRET